MTLQELIEQEGGEAIQCRVQQLAADLPLAWGPNVQTVLGAITANPELAPKMEAKSADEVLSNWLKKYRKGYDSRISRRVSKLPGTVPDPVIDVIVGACLPCLSPDDLARIRFGHRLAMSAENILGLLLEEFLSLELAPFGWYCCWGETVRSVDFANTDGGLLQVKNRSNSENSSSNKVRVGTEIQKWFRAKAKTGAYLWEELNRLHDTGVFSEERFQRFVTSTLAQNNRALPIEALNPWKRPAP